MREKSIKVGRITFGNKQEGWTNIGTLWLTKYNNLELSFSKRPSEGSNVWPKGTGVRFDDGETVGIQGKYPKIFMDDGYTVQVTGPGLDADDDGPDNSLPF